MNISDIPKALTGSVLKSAYSEAREQRKAIADGFLYEQTINMIVADPGTGKSTIAVQVALELAAGLPVFGLFQVPKTFKVLYIQTERNIIELLERIETISKVYPIRTDNLTITDEYQRFNLLNTEHSRLFIECIKRDCPGVEMIFIDPIYALVAGGLKEDVPASAFTKTMSNLQKETNATLWYNHHTVKPHYEKGVKYEREDPFYGSQWIKAHVTSSFHLKECTGGVEMVKKKDNYKLMPDRITLEFNPETGLCDIPFTELPASERVKNFIRSQAQIGREFTFKDIEASTRVCTRHLRELLVHSSISDMLIVVSSKGNKNLYKVAPPL